ncbi:MAG TPA: DUF998 domain-containing protein [Actinomycetota bacterium]|nr:DUF998 domain-containing protein [Actinomycetota bacterium]
MDTLTRTPTPLAIEPLTSTEAPDRRRTLAGLLLAVTGIGIVLSTITNEALYPAGRAYSTYANTISDLGGTLPPDSYMVQPNRAIFIVTMAVAGALVLASTYLLRATIRRRRMLVALGAMGVGLVGIAIFPGNVAGWHPLFSLVAFVGGSVATIMSRKELDPPASYLAVALGVIALVATALGLDAFAEAWPQTAIGIGGVERWIAYPVLLWMVLFGTALMGKAPRGGSRA